MFSGCNYIELKRQPKSAVVEILLVFDKKLVVGFK